LFLVLALVRTGFAGLEYCAVCKKELRDEIVTWEDKVTRTKNYLCIDCPKLPNSCYLCSLPVIKDFTTLPDGRVICKRDVSTVILDDQQAARICEQVKADLDRQFIRFITFPETNVTVGLMDRVAIQEIYKFAGNDYTCPNMWGCTRPKTNDQRLSFEISLLSGLPRELLIATCVHEYTHTWLIENTPAPRAKNIGKDAVEGFCELVSYLFARDHGYAQGVEEILNNHYTRGQIHLFIKAEQTFGFNDVVDWMKIGDSPLLLTNDLVRIRRLDTSPNTNTVATNELSLPELWATRYTNQPVGFPETLTLKSISGIPPRRLALINNRTLGEREQAVVRLATTNVSIRCLEIRTNSVLILFEETGAKQELLLPAE